MDEAGSLRDYRAAISERLGVDVNVTLFWKGRVALYAILKALGVGRGDEVIVPGFTCVVVPNAVIYTGAKPVYADIDPETFTITAKTVEPVVSEKTRVIISQNTYGLSADLDPIIELANRHGIEVLDDCAHGFGGTYKSRANGTTTRLAFFSTQWNKPFNTALGGFAVSRGEQVSQTLRQLEKETLVPSRRDVIVLKLMYETRRIVMRGGLYWPLLRLYRSLVRTGMLIGSSDTSELKSTEPPPCYLKGLSGYQARIGLAELGRFDANTAFRKRVANEYDVLLESMDKSVPKQPSYASHLFLKYPIRVTGRDRFLERAVRSRVRLGDWFLSPLHPVTGDLSSWGFDSGSCPVAEKASKEVLNLPTDPDMKERDLDMVKSFIRENKSCIL